MSKRKNTWIKKQKNIFANRLI